MPIMTPSGWILLVIYCSNLPVFLRLWWGNRQTSLAHAVIWSMLAWIAWIITLLFEPLGSSAGPFIYLALALTGCASIAVLGARRPGVKPWNAVVIGLLAVELLPLGEAAVRQGEMQLNGLRLATLAGAVSIGVMNYLPTRAFPGALLVGFGCACQLLRFMRADEGVHSELDWLGRSTLAAAPGAVLLCRTLLQPRHTGDFDRCWIAFRERFGVVWGQRLREQFNQSAKNSGCTVLLSWQGLRMQPDTAQPNREQLAAMLQTLVALMKRFGGSSKD
jgi:hypothetical protein